MRRTFRRSARSRKRSVAWVPGVSTQDTVAGTSSRLITLTSLGAPAANTFAASVALTDDTDLSMHGGEDAVLTRIRGRLFFSDGRLDSGAGLAAAGFQFQVSVVQTDISPALAVTPLNTTSSAGLGNDNVLWSGNVLCSSGVTTGTGTGIDALDWFAFTLDVDVKAKRKLQSDRQIIIWFQTTFGVGAVSADFRLRGALRTLLMRSR